MDNKSTEFKQVAPIVLFVYNRLDHTILTIESLARNHLAKESILWIFSDGSKKKTIELSIINVREYIHSVKNKSWFKEVNIVESSRNQGLANSIIRGVSNVIEHSSNVIVLEDDLVTAPDFLYYMNSCLAYFRNNKKVGAISGYSPIKNKNFPKNYTSDLYLISRNCSIGWATWDYIWVDIDWNVKDYDSFKKDIKERNRFNECGYDRSRRLDRQIKYNLNSWSIRFGYNLFKANKYTIYPKVSRLKHIGWDGTGTHSQQISSQNVKKFNAEIQLTSSDFILEIPSESKEITKMIKDIYSGSFIARMKRIVENIFFVVESIFKKSDS